MLWNFQTIPDGGPEFVRKTCARGKAGFQPQNPVFGCLCHFGLANRSSAARSSHPAMRLGAGATPVMTTSGDVLYVVVYKYFFPARGRDPVGREPSGLSPLPEDRPLPAPVTSVRQSGRPRRQDLSSGIFNFGWDLLFALVQNSPDPLNILHKWR
nr:hypothetical protein [uncultured Gellertiella sp.]